MFDQLTIFEIPDISKIKQEAMIYTVDSIVFSSGHRRAIMHYLKENDKQNAYKEFDSAFRNYGFGHGKYSFSSYAGKGRITVDREHEFAVTSRELFNLLLEVNQ